MKTKLIATFDEEKRLLHEGYDFVLGTDEAGRGPLAGPVVAAVCALRISDDVGRDEAVPRLYNEDEKWNLIRDSKTLSEKQRESLFDFISEHFFVGVGICDHETIDRMNILEASFLAMKKALTEISKKINVETPRRGVSVGRNIILVDGNKQIPSLSMEQKAIVSGDKLVKSIAAASIIAKVTRDRMICEMGKLYPEYGLAKHKGYGTKLHMEALKKYGPCPIHRRTFSPIKELVSDWTRGEKNAKIKI